MVSLRRIFANWEPRALTTRTAQTACLAVFLLFTVFPLLMSFFIGTGSASPALIDQRQFELLKNSLYFATGSASVALLLATPTGILLWDKSYSRLRSFLIFLILVPPYLYAQGFMTLSASPPPGLGFLIKASGINWSALICGVALSPMAALLISLAPYLLSSAPLESAKLSMDPQQILWRIVLPSTRYLFMAAGAMTFAFALLEGGLPLSLQTIVFATEITSKFLAGTSTAIIFVEIWPFFILILLPVLAIWPFIKKLQSRKSLNRQADMLSLKELQPLYGYAILAGTVIFLIFVSLPLLALLRQSFTGAQAGLSWGTDGKALLWSMATAFSSAGICGILVAKSGNIAGGFRILPLLAILTMVIPPSLHGTAWATTGAHFSWLPSFLVMVAAHCARALPLTLLVAFLAWKSFSRQHLMESASVANAPIGLQLRLRAPIIAVCTGIAAVVSLRELEVSLLTVPPGGQTLPLRIFNLMHYGAGADVARLSLVFAALLALAGNFLIRRWPK